MYSSQPQSMGTIGEVIRWLGLTLAAIRARVGRLYRRILARLLRRDQLVAGTEVSDPDTPCDPTCDGRRQRAGAAGRGR